MVSVVFRLVRSWLFCNSGFWLRLFVARFWLADVGCGVRCSSTLECLAFRLVGSGDTLSPVGTVQAGCFIAAFGYRRPPRHARASRVLGVGSQWHGCADAVDRKSTFFWCFQNKRAPFPHENRVLTLKLALIAAIRNCVNHGQATLRARTTPHTDSPSHNGSSVQLDPALHLPDLTGFWP